MRLRDSASQQPSVTMTEQKETRLRALDAGNWCSIDSGAV